MATALIHIGVYKTGTTSFQRWADENREALWEERGIDVYAGRYMLSHVEVALLCMRENRAHPMKERLLDRSVGSWRDEMTSYVADQVASDAPSLLVSAEDLSLLRYADEVETLAHVLSPRDLRVAVCFRDPSAYVESGRSQLQRLGIPSDNLDPSTVNLEWNEMLAAWRAVLGEEQVVAFNYEEAVARRGSTIPGVLDALGVDTRGLPPWDNYFENVTKEKERRQRSRYWRARRAFSRTRAAALARRLARGESGSSRFGRDR